MGHRIISTLYDDVKMQQVFGDKEAADIYEFCGIRTSDGYVPAPSAKKRKLEVEEEESVEKGNAYLVQRQSIFNISMCKLNRYRQIPDPSLRRSVLICNTLRTIESEMVSEGMEVDTVGASSFLPSIQTDNITTLDPLPPADYPSYPPPVAPSCPDPAGDLDYEKRLTDLDCASGRATPYPESEYRRPPDDSEGWEGKREEGPRGPSISWSSVLNFSSQSDMDATNNNVPDDIWNCEGGSSGAGGPNTSPSASSDSGISTASDEIFGDIDLSLYDFDLLPLSPPNVTRLVPPSAEELLRAFSNQPGPP